MPPAVSVIIPAYKAAKYIAGALDSVLAQTFTDYEVIVINDGSPDTAELEAALEPYRARITYLRQENRGVSGARNAGVRAARAEFIALLDSDDRWEPEFLASQIALLRGDPGLALVYADGIIFGGTPDAGRRLMDVSPSEDVVTFESLVTRKSTVHSCTTVARRAAMIGAGLFDEAISVVEDTDLWLRMVKNGGSISYQRRLLGRYCRRPGSLSADVSKMIESYISVLEKIGQHPAVTPAERALIERQQANERASLDLYKGKDALWRGDFAGARKHLAQANMHWRRPKLALMVMLVRLTPRLAQALYRRRFGV